MASASPTRVAFLGAGNIAGPYAQSVGRHPELALIGVYDLLPDKVAEFAAAHDCVAYSSVDELVADQPDIVVNLSSAPYHYATSLDLIERGMTVFSEKPLALRSADARHLVETAEARGTRLACAPSLWLGAAQQAAAAKVLAGEIGSVGLVKAEVNQGRIETWHPAPGSFYQVGPVIDAGVYPLTFLTAVLGPLRNVSAVSSMSVPDRVTLSGDAFTPPTADTWAIIGQFLSGAVLSLTCNFFVDSATQPRTVTFHGSDGSLVLDDWFLPGASIRQARYGEPLTESRAADDALEADWSLGVLDLAGAIAGGREHRTGAQHAAHVVDVLDAITRSAAEGVAVSIESTFPSPFHSQLITKDLNR